MYSTTPRSRFLRLLACLLCSPLPHGQVELTVHTVGQGLRSLWKKIKSLTPRRVLSLRRPSTTTNFQKETLFENEILYANLMRYEHFFVFPSPAQLLCSSMSALDGLSGLPGIWRHTTKPPRRLFY